MNRFYLSPQKCKGPRLALEDSEARHAARVLRLQPGAPVTVLDGAGTEYDCVVAAVNRGRIELRAERSRQHPRPCHDLTLLQAVPKGKVMESIIRKATELGVRRIVPLLTERSEVHLDSREAGGKRDKWETVMIEAIKQCGNPWLPQLDVPTPLPKFLQQQSRADLSLLASLQPDSQHLREPFHHHRQTHQTNPATVAVWIGPEGDFAPAEQDAILAAGALPVSLGPLVLRAETAAIAAIAATLHELTA